MGNWLNDNAWVAWVVAALALCGVEMLSLDLIFLMIAAGAVGGAVTALVTDAFLAQVLVAAGTSVAMLAVVRPVALRHLRTPPEVRTGTAALVGRPAVVLEQVDGSGGRVKLAGEVWSARSYDGSAVISPGRAVQVIEIEGATALVYETELP